MYKRGQNCETQFVQGSAVTETVLGLLTIHPLAANFCWRVSAKNYKKLVEKVTKYYGVFCILWCFWATLYESDRLNKQTALYNTRLRVKHRP